MLCSSVEKVVVCFTKISNLAVTTPLSMNKVRADLLFEGSLYQNTKLSLHNDNKITLSLQNVTSISNELTRLDLSWK